MRRAYSTSVLARRGPQAQAIEVTTPGSPPCIVLPPAVITRLQVTHHRLPLEVCIRTQAKDVGSLVNLVMRLKEKSVRGGRK